MQDELEDLENQSEEDNKLTQLLNEEKEKQEDSYKLETQLLQEKKASIKMR